MVPIYGRVYVIRNSINAKLYVGKTTRSIAQRFNEHVICQGKCRAIESAIRKYGANAFSIEELETAETESDLNALEVGWIAKFSSVSPVGYNLSAGGEGAGVMNEETKALIRANARRPEHLERFSEIRNRPDVRKKITASLRARWLDPEFRKAAGAAIKASLNRPDVKQRHIVALSVARNNPETKARHAAAVSEANSRPAVRAKRSAHMTRAWNEPGAREQRSAAIRAAKSTPEFRARYAATNALPEVKARRSASSSGRIVSAETRLKKSLAATGKKRGPYKDCKPRPAMAERWADPVWREKMLASRRDAALKKTAVQ